MSRQYADIIIDIVHGAVDRPFQYRVPRELEGRLSVGERVKVPFGKGNTLRDGYIIGFSGEPSCDPDKIKEIREAAEDCLLVLCLLIILKSVIEEDERPDVIDILTRCRGDVSVDCPVLDEALPQCLDVLPVLGIGLSLRDVGECEKLRAEYHLTRDACFSKILIGEACLACEEEE